MVVVAIEEGGGGGIGAVVVVEATTGWETVVVVARTGPGTEVSTESGSTAVQAASTSSVAVSTPKSE